MTRRTSAVATILCGAALGATAAGTWVSARAWTPVAQESVAVTGLAASPVLGATALLLVAAGIALALAGRLAGRVTALVVAAAAVLAAVESASVVIDPAGPAGAAAVAALGVARVDDPASTPLPWLALVVAAAGVAVGLRTVLAAGSWEPPGGSRYRRPTAPDGAPGGTDGTGAARDDVAAWDAMTRGEDPS